MNVAMCGPGPHSSPSLASHTSITSKLLRGTGAHSAQSQLKFALHEIILNANYVDTKNKEFAFLYSHTAELRTRSLEYSQYRDPSWRGQPYQNTGEDSMKRTKFC